MDFCLERLGNCANCQRAVERRAHAKAPGLLTAIVMILFEASLLANPSHLQVSASSPEHQGMMFTVSVTAQLADGTVDATYNGPLTLTASNTVGQVDLSGGAGLVFTNGLWSGMISISTNGTGLILHAETSGGIGGDTSVN